MAEPSFKVTRETSGVVRSTISVGACQILVHPQLGVGGGSVQSFEVETFTHPERLCPGAELYIFEGVELTSYGQKRFTAGYHVLGDGETMADARAIALQGFKVERSE